MTTVRQMTEVVDERGLVAQARSGNRSAFDDLYERHAPTAWRLALVVAREPGLAAGAVVEAFAHGLGSGPRRHLEPTPTLRAQLLQGTRAAAVAGTPPPAGLSLPSTDLDDDGAGAALGRLPERWRSVLWVRDVEGLEVAEVATVLAMTSQGSVQLADRARHGLREQVALTLRETATTADCRRTTECLAGYASGALSPRDTTRARRHLDRCEACRTCLDQLDDLAPHLRRRTAPLPIAVAAFAQQAWLDRTRGAAGPFGLHMPNGHPVPAWAERTLAGATAAVVSLGITTAVLLAGRDGGSPADTTPAAADQPIGADLGESALGTLDDDVVAVDSEGSGTPPPLAPIDPPAPADGPADGASGAAVDSGAGAGSAPATSGGAPTPRSPGAAPAPTSPPPTSVPPPTSPPPTTVPPEPEGPLDDVLDPIDVCTGVTLLDDLVGCDAPATGPLSGLGL